MLKTAVFPGKYIQGEGALGQLVQWIGAFGSKGLIVASGTARNRLLSAHREALHSAGVGIEPFGGECCAREVERVSARIRAEKIDVVVGMGGGKSIDLAKIAADRAGLPVIVVPTIASTDAPCSGCAVLYSEEGTFESVYYQKGNPQVVLVDSAVIAAAPPRFLSAGMGDALATWFEARSCQRTQSPNACGGLSTAAGLALARLCYDTLLAHGPTALLACAEQAVTPALDHIIEANILLSGLGFECSGLATAHAVHNGLTALPATHAFFHGEKVAFGVLTGLHLTDADAGEIDRVYDFCAAVGLPTTLAALGLGGVDRAQLLKVAEKACLPEEAIHHEAGEITPGRVLSALLAADAMGRARQAAGGNDVLIAR